MHSYTWLQTHVLLFRFLSGPLFHGSLSGPFLSNICLCNLSFCVTRGCLHFSLDISWVSTSWWFVCDYLLPSVFMSSAFLRAVSSGLHFYVPSSFLYLLCLMPSPSISFGGRQFSAGIFLFLFHLSTSHLQLPIIYKLTVETYCPNSLKSFCSFQSFRTLCLLQPCVGFVPLQFSDPSYKKKSSSVLLTFPSLHS